MEFPRRILRHPKARRAGSPPETFLQLKRMFSMYSQPSHFAPKARRGFSLVELLVVIGIISVLVSMLIPAVQKARDAAASVQCKSNLHQLGVAVHNYSAGFNQNLPPGLTGDTTNGRVYWFGSIAGGTTIVDPSGGSLSKYFESDNRLIQCPALDLANLALDYEGKTGGYGYNYEYLAPPVYASSAPWGVTVPVPSRVDRIKSTAATIVFADALGVDSFSTTARQANPVLIETPLMEPPSFTYPTVNFRHSGHTANVLFLDGHVESMTPTINAPASWEPASVTALRTLHNIFDIGVDDRIWDRN